MTEKAQRSCGCRWIHAGGSWWHVVACPDHAMMSGPHDSLPETER